MTISHRRSSVLAVSAVLVRLSATSPAAAADPPTCKGELPNTRVFGGIVNVTTKKSWQPRGGEFTFVIDTPAPIPNDALITVCFGWKLAGKPADPKGFIESRPTHVVKLDPDRKSITIAATVPELPPAPPLFGTGAVKDEHDGKLGIYWGFLTVPVADVRILVYQPNGESVADILTTVGVTRVTWAVVFALGGVVLALALLYVVSRIRQPQLAGANPFLRIIASERNYASLSQAQIILWSLVVGASAVYVMALSGDLIEITGGTLVLLGISGAATVATTWKAASDEQTKAVSVPPKALPEWSDLVVSLEKVDGALVQTIDVTRVQMLFFTLITAAFVVLKVAASYEIPAIPDGFIAHGHKQRRVPGVEVREVSRPHACSPITGRRCGPGGKRPRRGSGSRCAGCSNG